ncbi:MAG: hypothetical protein HY711_08755 [Candidatus Melainabacteria bacterium]|nr:hypothetical protein [Candidatus Melainabacteria bacterium]
MTEVSAKKSSEIDNPSRAGEAREAKRRRHLELIMWLRNLSERLPPYTDEQPT